MSLNNSADCLFKPVEDIPKPRWKTFTCRNVTKLVETDVIWINHSVLFKVVNNANLTTLQVDVAPDQAPPEENQTAGKKEDFLKLNSGILAKANVFASLRIRPTHSEAPSQHQ